jgi:hypothetical protein
MAHARRKFNDLWANHRSEVGRKALRYFQVLFRIEREIEDLPSDERRRIGSASHEGCWRSSTAGCWRSGNWCRPARPR